MSERGAVAVLVRWVPGFVWVRLVLLPLDWHRPSSWWAVRGIVRTRAVGPVRLITMRRLTVEQTMRRYREALP